jgi:hypothetical protein
MKRTLYLSFSILAICLLVSCKGRKKDVAITTDSTGKVVETEVFAVCIWDKISLRDAPSDKGKYLTSLNIGEKCTYLDQTQEDKSGKKPVTYIKIQLQNKQEGWVSSDYVILKSRPAAIIKEADVYSRPDLLTKAGKTYSTMDIVAVKSEQGEFIEVAGKRKNGKWIETGWIKASNVTYNDIDIATAKYGSKAIAIEDKQKREAAINEIINNSDLSSSVFIKILSNNIGDENVSDQSPSTTTTEEHVEGD